MDCKPSMKRRRRGKRGSGKVPPIFIREYPPFVPQDSLPQDIFPVNVARPPTKPMDTQEILNRFSQLLDWRLYPGDNTPSCSDQNRSLRDNADRYNPPIEDEIILDRNSSNIGKRKIIDPNDLRNRLDQQYKRFKYSDERGDNYQGVRREESSIVDDYNERGMQGNSNIDNDSWGDNYRGNDHKFRGDHPLEVPVSDRPLRERDFDDRWVKMDGNEVPARSSGRPFDNIPSSNPDRMVINERNTAWPNDRVYTSEEKWAVNVEDFCRKVKEHRPERIPTDFEPRPHISDDHRREYSAERGTNRHAERNDSYNDNWNKNWNDYDGGERYHYRNAYDNRDDREHISVRRDREAFSADDRDTMYRMRPGDREYFPGDFRDTPRRMPPGIGDYNPPPNDMPSCSRNDGPRSYDNVSRYQPSDDDLTVIIFKKDESKITYQDADSLRKMLIDLVVNCGNPDQMPEFKRSGIMWGSKGFYVICRTQETLDWLLKQNLPPLNDVQLFMRRNRIMEIVKVSAFAPKCTRTRDEVFKLLKLQNGKKGFNFNNWMMRGYQLTPKGVYMSFDIGLDEARLLDEMGCELSFELKALTFKIATNSVHVVSDFKP